jgi:Transposase domain (DUF772)
MSNFRPFDRETGFLLPPSLDDWLPERHLARFVVEVIGSLDLSAMARSYRGTGSASYHPALLLGVLVYGYTTGVFSSRKLERATYDSVAFRFIGGLLVSSRAATILTRRPTIGVDFRAVQSHRAQPEQAHLARQLQHPHEQRFDVLEKATPKRCYGVVVGMIVRGGEACFETIVDDLAKTFGAPRERVLADVIALLQGLADKKLLEL